jgi:hypothetical protein
MKKLNTNAIAPIKYFVFAGCLSLAAISTFAHAEKQTLKATIGDKVFESDDEGITLVPVKDSFTISAITKGFMAYPSPPGLSDMLSISCRQFDAKPRKYTADDFAYGRCNATFAKGRSKQPFGKDEATYKVNQKKVSPKTFVEITKVSGKVMEGRFSIEMMEEDGTKKVNVEGAFKAEDRQK